MTFQTNHPLWNLATNWGTAVDLGGRVHSYTMDPVNGIAIPRCGVYDPTGSVACNSDAWRNMWLPVLTNYNGLGPAAADYAKRILGVASHEFDPDFLAAVMWPQIAPRSRKDRRVRGGGISAVLAVSLLVYPLSACLVMAAPQNAKSEIIHFSFGPLDQWFQCVRNITGKPFVFAFGGWNFLPCPDSLEQMNSELKGKAKLVPGERWDFLLGKPSPAPVISLQNFGRMPTSGSRLTVGCPDSGIEASYRAGTGSVASGSPAGYSSISPSGSTDRAGN